MHLSNDLSEFAQLYQILKLFKKQFVVAKPIEAELVKVEPRQTEGDEGRLQEILVWFRFPKGWEGKGASSEPKRKNSLGILIYLLQIFLLPLRDWISPKKSNSIMLLLMKIKINYKIKKISKFCKCLLLIYKKTDLR